MEEDLHRSIPLARDALRLDEEIYGRDDAYVALATINLASYLALAGETDEALSVARRGVDIMRKQADDPAQAYKALRLLGQIHVRRGEFALATPVLDEAIGVRDKPGTKQDASLASAYASRAIARSMLHQEDDAVRDAARADELMAQAQLKGYDMLQYLQLRSRFDLLSKAPPRDCARQERIENLAQGKAAVHADALLFGKALLAACRWRRAPEEANWRAYAMAAGAVRQGQGKEAFHLALLDEFERRAGRK
jgi:hypothetical protein